jgi:hypothetical protein
LIYESNEFGNNVTSNITVVSTESEKQYLYKAGIEYFQIITGYTWEDLTATGPLQPIATIGGGSSVTNSGVLWKYFYQNKISYIDASASSHTPPWFWVNDYQTQEILILTRGVDPYTEKQEIKYDLSELFGQTPDTITITGNFFLNIPIQQNDGGVYSYDYKTPQTHANANDNSNINLFHQPIGFTVDVAAFTGFTTDSPRYYVSTDKSTLNYIHGSYDAGYPMSNWINLNGAITAGNGLTQNFRWVTTLPAASGGGIINEFIGRVDGGSFTVTNGTKYLCYNGGLPILPPPNFTTTSPLARCYSPAYHIAANGYTPITTNINPSQRLIFRSDRLPTSDITDTVGYNSFPLHQNNNFSFYSIDEQGQLTNFSAAGDGVEGLNDLDAFSELGTGSTSTIVETFSCEGMVPLKCYSGSGINFGVSDPCTFNQTGENGQNKRVNGGCYYFVDDKLIKTIKDDINYLAEWKTRFRIIFGACRGVFGHMFQNNWINGTLYMPTFNKQTTYNIIGEPNYNFCKDIVMFNDISNNFYYRSTPYADNINEFIGGPQPTVSNFLTSIIGQLPDDSQNDRQILFPTTIMDLGKRDEFISEICGDPDFSGRYIGNTIKSTSYQDSSDVLQLAIISRIVNSTFLDQVLSVQNGGIEQFFNRTGDRIDGDIAQSFSINSEYQVNPFIGGNYPDEYIFVSENTNEEPVFGIFYNTSENEYRNRRALSPGFNIYSFQTNPPLQTYVGYPDTQEVPLYKWKIDPQNSASIFGNQYNNWYTNKDGNSSGNGFYKRGYQDLDAVSDEYFKTSDMSQTFPNIYYGFITNYAVPPAPPAAPPAVPPAQPNPNTVLPSPTGVLVGSPNHFYFGLKNGKTALNRFINIYIDTELD